MYHVRLLQKYDFDNIVISIKSSNVPRMMAAYRLLAGQTDYPLHVLSLIHIFTGRYACAAAARRTVYSPMGSCSKGC